MKKSTPAKIIKTEDGSHTVISTIFQETYHSKYGAIQESKHVFLKAGLYPIWESKNDISILEIGFGTGLNAFLTLLDAERHEKKITYDALEAYPLPIEQALQLNYPELLNASPALWQKIHESRWGEIVSIHSSFLLQKIKIHFEDFVPNRQYDLIYYDAFAPEAQPELWDIPMLEKMYRALNKDGILVTYCAKGYVKRNLKAVGFTIESIPGPPGKREMTRAKR